MHNVLGCASLFRLHGSYKLEKVLNFSSHLEKSLKFSNLLMPYHFSEKLNDFAEKSGALTTNNQR